VRGGRGAGAGTGTIKRFYADSAEFLSSQHVNAVWCVFETVSDYMYTHSTSHMQSDKYS
jgi:hypothetical protein